MPKLKTVVALGMILLLVVTGCQALLPTAQILSQAGIEIPVEMPSMAIAVTPTTEAMEEATPLPTEEPTEEPTALPTEEPTEEATPLPTEEPTALPTEEPTAPPTEEPTAEPTPLPTEEPVAEATVVAETAMTETVATAETTAISETTVMTETTAMTETATPTTTSAVDSATVLVPSLRIRSGPGTTFDVIGGAVQGERYPVTGQALECQWYQIDHPQLGVAWIAGGDFAATDGPCAEIPAVDPVSIESSAAAPTTDAVATPTPVTLQPTPTPAAGVVPTVAPAEEATAQPADETADPFPTDKGCLLLQNQLGPELTFTFTSTDGVFAETVKVTSAADVPYCLNPGSYRVTVDAPPPWADINEEFTVAAGDRFFFPIRPQ